MAVSWNFDWSIIADALTSLIHKIGETIDLVIQTINLSFS